MTPRIQIKAILALLILGWSYALLPVNAQEVMHATRARKIPPVRFSTGMNYQERTHNDNRVHELSTLIGVQLSVMHGLDLKFGLGQAVAGGDNLAEIRGFTDAQVAVGYTIQTERSHILFNLGATLPTGASNFSVEEFETVAQISLSQFDFRVPFFGQGSSLAPGITYVTTLSRSVVVSLGASYRLRNSFEPNTELTDAYNLGNELLLTFGGEAQLGKTVSITADAIYQRYASDKLGNIEIFEAGSRFFATIQLHKTLPGQDIWLIARYRAVETDRALAGNVFRAEPLNAFPGFYQLRAIYRLRPNARIYAGFMAESTWFNADFAFEKLNVLGLGFVPEIVLSPALTLPIKATYLFGDLSGFEASVGINAIF